MNSGLQNRRNFLRISGEHRRKRGERELRARERSFSRFARALVYRAGPAYPPVLQAKRILLMQPIGSNQYLQICLFKATSLSPSVWNRFSQNVPLQRTLIIILDRMTIFNNKLIDKNLKKSTLRKLIRDPCTKTVFSCNNKLFEQTDGVSMGGSQGPVLANIIMTQFEQTVVKPLIDRKLITFYCRYVDNTLLLIKPDTIDLILDYFHKFDKNIPFTYDLFENTTPHFLDINISPNGIGIYRKYTFSGKYTNFDSFVPWRHKISWIRALVDRIHRICSPNMVKLELKILKRSPHGMAFRHVFLVRLFAASHTTPLTRITQQPTTPKINW